MRPFQIPIASQFLASGPAHAAEPEYAHQRGHPRDIAHVLFALVRVLNAAITVGNAIFARDTGDVIWEKRLRIAVSAADALVLSAGSSLLPPQGSAAERAETVRKALDKPAVFIGEDGFVRAREKRCAIEIVPEKPAPDTRPRPDGGFAVVKLDKGGKYQLRIRNEFSHDAAVRITIDGVNICEFAEAESIRRSGTFIVGAGQTTVIRGWYHNHQESYEFRVGQLATSVASKPALRGGSVITATFSAAWGEKDDPPSDEPKSGLNAGTELGSNPGEALRVVKRKIGVTREVVSVVIDSGRVEIKQPPREGRKVALIVGVGEYDHAKFSNLQCADKDAEALAALLGKNDYEVILLSGKDAKKPTLAEIRKALDTVLKTLLRDDLFLFSFSGHGLGGRERGTVPRSGGREARGHQNLSRAEANLRGIRSIGGNQGRLARRQR